MCLYPCPRTWCYTSLYRYLLTCLHACPYTRVVQLVQVFVISNFEDHVLDWSEWDFNMTKVSHSTHALCTQMPTRTPVQICADMLSHMCLTCLCTQAFDLHACLNACLNACPPPLCNAICERASTDVQRICQQTCVACNSIFTTTDVWSARIELAASYTCDLAASYTCDLVAPYTYDLVAPYTCDLAAPYTLIWQRRIH